MVRYIHGSEDSTDVDVFYVFDELPPLNECKKFCSENELENRNIIVINGGEVVSCYKGTPDEVNNSLLRTYNLHSQEYPLLVDHSVERDVTIKVIRSIRIILSHLSRSQFRPRVKSALNSELFSDKLSALRLIDLTDIEYGSLNKNMSREDILKTIAFQMGQTVSLIDGNELFTKSEVAAAYPTLNQFLYRSESSNLADLEAFKRLFIGKIESVGFESNGSTLSDGKTAYNVKEEKKIS